MLLHSALGCMTIQQKLKKILYNLMYTVAVSQFHAGGTKCCTTTILPDLLTAIPPERDVYMKDLKLPLPPDTPSIESLIRVCINLLCLVVIAIQILCYQVTLMKVEHYHLIFIGHKGKPPNKESVYHGR